MKFKIFIFIVDIVNLSFKAKFYFYKKNLNLKKIIQLIEIMKIH